MKNYFFFGGYLAFLTCFLAGCGAPTTPESALDIRVQELAATTSFMNSFCSRDTCKPPEFPGIKMQDLSSTTTNYTVMAFVPHFDKKIIDAALEKTINEQVEGFKEQVHNTMVMMKDEGMTFKDTMVEHPDFLPVFQDTYSILRNDDQIVSVVFQISTFFGGNHSGVYFVSKNFDAQTGKELLLPDVLGKNPKALETISNVSMSNLMPMVNQKHEDDMKQWVGSGAGPNWDNFRNFALTSTSLFIQFDPYQVAYWAAGTPTTSIPYSILKPYFTPELEKLLNVQQ